MKKTALFAGLVLASVLGAHAADIYSANVVGYTKVDIKPGLTMLGSQFVPVNADGSYDINEFMAANDLPKFDGDTFKTQMKVWGVNDQGYPSYTTYAWVGDFGNYGEDYRNKWLHNQESVAVVDMDLGLGFWIITPENEAASTITFAGQVATNSTFDVTINPGLNMINNPYPQAISIQNIQSESLPKFDGNTFKTQMKVWGVNDQGYPSYTTYAWVGDFGNYGEDYRNKWLLNQESVANFTIPVGQAMWIIIPEDSAPATITFTK